jgi:hypothetical protein
MEVNDDALLDWHISGVPIGDQSIAYDVVDAIDETWRNVLPHARSAWRKHVVGGRREHHLVNTSGEVWWWPGPGPVMRRGLGVGRGAGQRRHVSGSMGRRTVAMLTAASMFVEAEPALTAELALVRDELRVCDGKCIGEFNDTFVLTNDVVG